MPIEKLSPITAWTDQRLDLLKSEYPQCFVDGKVNKELLLEVFGEILEDESQEHFGLFWPGKREARRLAAMPSKGTLIPQPGQGIDEDATHNLFIEGDNLEVLKLLQKSYAGRVKMIYIDPPYNTGNDFVYPDDYSEPLDAYLKRTEQVDEAGQLLTTNSRESGRFHSNWLNMMFPRLFLARQLLRDDGVIFISIDDNEEHHLKILMNEVFGEENFRANISWQKKYSVSNNQKGIASIRDIIYVYAKTDAFTNGLFPRTEESIARYINPDDDPRGPWKAVDYWNQVSPEQRPNLVYTIINPNTGKKIVPSKKAWKFSHEVYEEHVKTNRLWWGKNGTNSVPALKLFLTEVKDGLIPHNWWTYEETGHTDEAKKELQELFDGIAPFDTPKPVGLIKRMCQLADLKRDDLVLDFFAGSCTTAHALLDLNNLDGGSRHFIMVQLPEPVENGIYKTIADIGRDRIKRVIKRDKKKKQSELNLGITKDSGFKSFILAQTNFTDWQPFTGKDTSQLELRFEQSENPLIEGWTPKNLLAELLLMQGFPLDSQVRSLPEFKGNDVQQVTSEFVTHPLFICLDKKIKPETVAKLQLAPQDIFVCLDTALADEAKIKLADQCNLKVI